MISEMLGAWQVGDVDKLHKDYADDVTVVNGAYAPPDRGLDELSGGVPAAARAHVASAPGPLKYDDQGARQRGVGVLPVGFCRYGGRTAQHGARTDHAGDGEEK